MVVGKPMAGMDISPVQGTGSDHITANLNWDQQDCRILPQLVHSAKNARLPTGFPNFDGLDKRVGACSGQLSPNQAIDLYNTMTSVQPQYRDYSQDAAVLLTDQLRDGKTLAPADQHRLQAIGEFPDYPGAAMLRAKELNGQNLTLPEMSALAGAYEFPDNPFAAGLAARQISGHASPAEIGLLNIFRGKHKSQQGAVTVEV
jgi:hypothetical protein